MKILAVLLAMASPDVNIPGGNLVTQTWTLANSPYVVSGDCTVPVGQTLTIEPGVVVRFAGTDGNSSGLDTTRIEITILGSLVANGTAGSKITFEASSGTTPGTWYGIVVAGGGNASISHAIVRHGATGLTRDPGAGTFSLQDSTFSRNSGNGAKLVGLSATISNLTFSENPVGLWCLNPMTGTVQTSTFTDSSVAGLRSTFGIVKVARSKFSGNFIGFWGDGGAGTVASCAFSGNTLLGAQLLANAGEDYWFDHDSFSHNPTGIRIVSAFTGDQVMLSSCIFASGTTGVLRDPGGTTPVVASDLLFWSNGTDLDGVTATTSRVGNPHFVSAPADLHLSAGSAAMSQGGIGLPLATLDLDGVTRPQGAGHDIGAYEFPAGANDAPVLGPIGARSIAELSTLTFTIAATDLDGEPSTYSATGLPPGATLDPATGAFSWAPAAGALGASPYSVTFTASDGVLNDSEAVLLTVTPPPAVGRGSSGGGGGCGLTGVEVLALLRLRRAGRGPLKR